MATLVAVYFADVQRNKERLATLVLSVGGRKRFPKTAALIDFTPESTGMLTEAEEQSIQAAAGEVENAMDSSFDYS